MKKNLPLLMLVMLTVSITYSQNEGYHWSFGSVPPVASSPAITGSAGSYPLTSIGPVGNHYILTKTVGLGASCAGAISVDSLDIPSGFEFSNAPQFVGNTWTIDITLNYSTPPGNYRRLLGFDDLGTAPDGDNGIYLEAITGEVILWDGVTNHILGGPVIPGTWYNLVFMRDDVTKFIRYYQNGVFIGQFSDAANTFVPKVSNLNKITFFKDDGTEESDVEIAKLSIYNRLLTESEIEKKTFANVCNTSLLLPPAPREGHQWVFTGTSPFVSTPAVAASLGTYNLATIIPGGAMTTGTTEDPALGSSCTTPVPIGVYPTDAGVVFDNSPRYVYNTYTIEMAVNITTVGGLYRRLVGFHSLAAIPAGDYGIYVDDAGGDVDFYNGTSHVILGAPLTSNTWFHLVFVRDATGLISYYQNGALVGTFLDALNEFVPQGANDNDITFLKDDGGEEIDGRIRKIGIFNVPLSAGDVLERFNTICNSALVVLPVSLKNFIAVKVDKQVDLTWTTAVEENNLGFEVQRSSDGITYTTVGFVKGSGTSSQENTYYFTDPSPLAGNNYYRLKQIDITNFATFSTIRRINMDKIRQDLQLFPNPARGAITITNIKAGDLLSIFNTHGNLIIRKTASSGQESLSVEKLAAGVYVLQVTDKENSKRIIRFTKF